MKGIIKAPQDARILPAEITYSNNTDERIRSSQTANDERVGGIVENWRDIDAEVDCYEDTDIAVVLAFIHSTDDEIDRSTERG